MLLPTAWYAVLDSSELHQNPLGFRRFGKDFVGWRNSDGRAIVMADLCPHRGAKLSLGHLADGCLHCPFHGFQFSESGQCRCVPETRQPALNLKVEVIESIESDGMLWLYPGTTRPEWQPHWFSELAGRTDYSLLVTDWQCHVSRCVENQLDYAHLPYVHRTTIGKGFDAAKSVAFEMDATEIKFFPGGDAIIHFLFPNVWRNYVAKDLHLSIAFAPIDDSNTRLYVRSYSKYTKLALFGGLASYLLNQTNRVIINQDRKVVHSQLPMYSLDAVEEKLYPSDKAIVHFRKWWRDAVSNE